MGALKRWKVRDIVSSKREFIFVIIIHSANSYGYVPCFRCMAISWGNRDEQIIVIFALEVLDKGDR